MESGKAIGQMHRPYGKTIQRFERRARAHALLRPKDSLSSKPKLRLRSGTCEESRLLRAYLIAQQSNHVSVITSDLRLFLDSVIGSKATLNMARLESLTRFKVGFEQVRYKRL